MLTHNMYNTNLLWSFSDRLVSITCGKGFLLFCHVVKFSCCSYNAMLINWNIHHAIANIASWLFWFWPQRHVIMVLWPFSLTFIIKINRKLITLYDFCSNKILKKKTKKTNSPMHYPIIALMHGSHGLSARRAWRTLSSRPEGPQPRSRAPAEGP